MALDTRAARRGTHDLAIIGGGPVGLTAGLCAARGRLDVVLLERLSPGGQVLNTDRVENYPGFPEGICGFDLMDRMKPSEGLQTVESKRTMYDGTGPAIRPVVKDLIVGKLPLMADHQVCVGGGT